MNSPQDHYEQFLAAHYVWMAGGHETQVARNRQFFGELGLAARPGSTALDLGCGPGFQSLALAELQFDVVAVDTSALLLAELQALAQGRRIAPVQADMREEAAYVDYGPFDVAVCMGDSLIHLAEIADVAMLCESLFRNLRDGGRLVLSFRDLSRELEGADRFVPVRLDEDRLMAAFLEYQAQHVLVHDVLFRRTDGQWTMSKSAYRKLRLPIGQAVGLLKHAGFRDVQTRLERGFATIVARKGDFFN